MSIRGLTISTAIKGLRKTANNAIQINNARKKRQQDDELFKLKKKQLELNLEEKEMRGEIDSLQRDVVKNIYKEMFKKVDTQNKATSESIKMTEHKNKREGAFYSNLAQQALEGIGFNPLTGQLTQTKSKQPSIDDQFRQDSQAWLSGEATEEQVRAKYGAFPKFQKEIDAIRDREIEGLGGKSKVDLFQEDVSGGQMSAQDLRVKYPQYVEDIDRLEIAGVFGKGQQSPPAQAVQAEAVGQAGQEHPQRPNLVVEKYDALGRPKEQTNLDAIPKKVMAKKEGEMRADVIKGRLVNTNNLSMISGVMHDLAKVYADAYAEGGAGGMVQEGMAGVANKVGDLPGGVQVGGKFAASGAFPGKRMELILKLMPMLTQQATKPEGSVRLVTGVLEALSLTIPELGTAPKTALRQLQETQRTFYRFAKVAEELGLSLDEVFRGKNIEEVPEDEIKAWARTIASNSEGIEIAGEERKALDKIMSNTLLPLEKIVAKQAGGVLMQDANGARAIVNPETMELIEEM